MSKLYWDRRRILSYNALWNAAIGARGIGKTWNAKEWAISTFIKSGAKCAWVMRYQTELDKALKNEAFKNDIAMQFPDHDLKVDGDTLCIKHKDEEEYKPMMTFTALSKRSLKAISDPMVDKFIFDEFIPLPGIPYLKDEVEKCLEYYFTISRGRDVRALFLGNNITSVSPYFQYFHRSLPKKGTIECKNDFAIEFCQNKPFEELMKGTRFGRMVEGTNYSKYAIENESLVDLHTFVCDKPAAARCMVRLDTIMGTLYLWIKHSPYAIYVSENGDPACTCWTVGDAHHEGALKADSTGSIIRRYISANYADGSLFFTSEKAKATFMATCWQMVK